MEEKRPQEEANTSDGGGRCNRKWQDRIHSLTHILTSPTTNPSLHSQLFISTHNPDPSIDCTAYPPFFSPPLVLFQWSITHLFFPRLLTRGLPHSSWRSKCPLQQPPPLVLSTGIDPAPERWGAEERKMLFRKRLNRPSLGTHVPALLGIFMPNLFIFTLLLWDPLSLRKQKNAPPFL
ncbi:hypothetical protein ZOSMA_172G00400 [Zostera marina]|uniref:Uncharacterized protein n=1 Tax=Zostera marina TaxID=29655 RepID=A0A0K9PSE7_ZOSMR|nr:hypothetical protein ZOSMA_172G00400 [Zostera marina]